MTRTRKKIVDDLNEKTMPAGGMTEEMAMSSAAASDESIAGEDTAAADAPKARVRRTQASTNEIIEGDSDVALTALTPEQARGQNCLMLEQSMEQHITMERQVIIFSDNQSKTGEDERNRAEFQEAPKSKKSTAKKNQKMPSTPSKKKKKDASAVENSAPAKSDSKATGKAGGKKASSPSQKAAGKAPAVRKPASKATGKAPKKAAEKPSGTKSQKKISATANGAGKGAKKPSSKSAPKTNAKKSVKTPATSTKTSAKNTAAKAPVTHQRPIPPQQKEMFCEVLMNWAATLAAQDGVSRLLFMVVERESGSIS